ncbi:MAG: DUF308 domain-containing protein [Eubacteriales bacterium]|nr:DUF308 domain-containing protein [Eubacteriales bacterium]
MSRLSRVFLVLAGVLLIAAGVFCMNHEEATLLSVAFLLGFFMMLSGIIELFMYAKERKIMKGAGWVLLDGIVTVLLSVLLIGNQAFTLLSLPFMFAMWLLFSGGFRCVSAFELKKAGVSNWGWVMFMGIILILGGFLGMMNPLASMLAIGWMVGFSLIFEGVDTIICGLVSGSAV